jgi:hypothetical protein
MYFPHKYGWDFLVKRNFDWDIPDFDWGIPGRMALLGMSYHLAMLGMSYHLAI